MRATQPYAGGPVVVTDAKEGNGLEIALAWVFTVLTGFYLLPWAIAATRGKANSMTVFWVNLLLGWTVIGFVVALVLACLPHRALGYR